MSLCLKISKRHNQLSKSYVQFIYNLVIKGVIRCLRGMNVQDLNPFEKIYLIQKLIDSGQGDTGRLSFIKECIEKNKSLFRSDQKYIETKFANMSLPSSDEKIPERETLASINELLKNGIGDAGRLQHIYNMLEAGKTLFKSDREYLEHKLDSLEQNTSFIPVNELDVDLTSFSEIQSPCPDSSEIINLKNLLNKANEKIDNIEQVINTKKTKLESPKISQKPTEPKLRGTMPKDWVPPSTTSEKTDMSGVYEEIKSEEEKLEKQKQFKEQINLQENKLTQIILNREEYEKQLSIERTRLEEKIHQERSKIDEQTKLAEQIRERQNELDQAKKERAKITEELQEEQKVIEIQVNEQKSKLEKIKTEYAKTTTETRKTKEKIETELEKEQEKLSEQDKLMQSILEEKSFLDEIKQKRENLAQAMKEERNKISRQTGFADELKTEKITLGDIKLEKQKLLKQVKEEQNILKKIRKEKEVLEKQIHSDLQKN